MISAPQTHPLGLFKGIALFTPGGDLVYCIDPYKRDRWHLQLCAVIQETLGLSEHPHFLANCYTATVDRWLDPHTQTIKICAEACPSVLRHQALLNAVFETGDLVWQPSPCIQGLCDAVVLSSYRQQFPELWKDHDLVIRFERTEPSQSSTNRYSTVSLDTKQAASPKDESQGYVLRLFVSGSNAGTEYILKSLHQLLESSLQQPYTLKVVDIYKNPEQAEIDQVAATPTLVKAWPLPIKRIVGDLDDVSKILQILASPPSGSSS